MELKPAFTVIFTIGSIVSGLMLYRMGRPLPTGMFTLHKLSAVAFFVLTGMQVYAGGTILGFTVSLLSVVAGLSLMMLFVSGAVLSISKETIPSMRYMHNGSVIISVAAVLFQILRR